MPPELDEVEYPPLDRRDVLEPLLAYRFVHVDELESPRLARDFWSDRAKNKVPIERELVYPDLQDGISMYKTLEQSRGVWLKIAHKISKRPRIGDFVAEVLLAPELGLEIEDLDEEDGHITVWGEPDQLADLVQAFYPSDETADN